MAKTEGGKTGTGVTIGLGVAFGSVALLGWGFGLFMWKRLRDTRRKYIPVSGTWSESPGDGKVTRISVRPVELEHGHQSQELSSGDKMAHELSAR